VRRGATVVLRVAGLFFVMLATLAAGQDSREAVNRETSKPVIRGGIVFKSYCGLFHGEHGDGKARAAKLYGKLNLAIKHRSAEYYETIIRQGGPVGGDPRSCRPGSTSYPKSRSAMLSPTSPLLAIPCGVARLCTRRIAYSVTVSRRTARGARLPSFILLRHT